MKTMKLIFNTKICYNVPGSIIQFASFSVCFKAFEYTDNIIVDIDSNTNTDPSLDNVIADNDPNTDNNSISYAHNTDNNIVVVDPYSEQVLTVVPGSVTLVLNFPAS